MPIFDIFRKKKKLVGKWEKYYKQEDINYKIPDVSMYQQLKNTAIKYPDDYAYQYFEKKVKFSKFIKQIDKTAYSFKKIGVKKGDIITICLPNVPEALICVYALNKLGAIANMLHPLSAEEEIKQSLISTKSIYLVCIDINYSKIENIICSTNIKKTIFVSASNSMNLFLKIGYFITNKHKYKSYPHNEKNISWNKFYNLSNFCKKEKIKPFGKNTPAVILHSGGTTGKAKNVVIQNRAFVLIVKQGSIALKNLTHGNSCLTIMPNFHGFGLSVCMHTCMSMGSCTILIPRFNSNKIDILFKKYKPTYVLGVPTLFEALINSNNVKKLDLSKLKYVISGGDKLSKSLETKINNYLEKHNCKTKIAQGYGLSEGLSAVCLACDELNKSGSIGIPLVGNHIKIINPSTRYEVKPGVTGEICVHSKALMMGYLDDETETNSSLQIHNDGHIWLHTGDLGYMDNDGYVYYVGRQKRMIITSGYNVYPSHIEEIIETHPAVLQCSVVGIKHSYKQEVPKAFIVLKEGINKLFLKTELKEYCKKRMAKYMIPAIFVFRKKLPKTKLGKVDFKKLQEDNGDDE